MKEYRLIKPDTTSVEAIWDLWFPKPDKNPQTKIRLFQDKEIVDFSGWCDSTKKTKKMVDVFREYGSKDLEIIEKRENSFPDFLKMINDTYHTRISFIKGGWHDDRWNKQRVVEMCKEELARADRSGDVIGIDRFIKTCKEMTGRYEYSFATKVFSFLYPEKYPILDSITVSLLNQYIQYDESKQSKFHGRNKWGNYQCYMEDYSKMLRDVWALNPGLSFKKVDVFLWTYGILIQKYWENQGIIAFNSVQYNDPVSI